MTLDRLWLCKSLWEDAGRLGHVGTDQMWQIKILTPNGQCRVCTASEVGRAIGFDGDAHHIFKGWNDECWTLTTQCMRFTQIYYGRTQSLSNRRICEILQPLWSDFGILPASIINLPLSHLLLTAKLHTASATIFLAFRFHSMILSRSSEKSYGQTHSLFV